AATGRPVFPVQQKALATSIPHGHLWREADTSHLGKIGLAHSPGQLRPETISTPDQRPFALPDLACTSCREEPEPRRCLRELEASTHSSPCHNLFVRRLAGRPEDLLRRETRRTAQGWRSKRKTGSR